MSQAQSTAAIQEPQQAAQTLTLRCACGNAVDLPAGHVGPIICGTKCLGIAALGTAARLRMECPRCGAHVYAAMNHTGPAPLCKGCQGKQGTDARFSELLGRVLRRVGPEGEARARKVTSEPATRPETALDRARRRIDLFLPAEFGGPATLGARKEVVSLDVCPSPRLGREPAQAERAHGRGGRASEWWPGAMAVKRQADGSEVEFYTPTTCTCVGARHYVPQNASQARARAVAAWFVDETLAGRAPLVVFIGPTGVGKSHLMYAALVRLAYAGVDSFGLCWLTELADLLRERTDPALRLDEKRAAHVHGRIAAMKKAGAGGLDEIRGTSSTDFDTQEISKLVMAAHDRSAGLILTTQLSRATDHAPLRGMNDVDAATHSALTNLIGAGAMGRLRPAVMDGPNYRKPRGL